MSITVSGNYDDYAYITREDTDKVFVPKTLNNADFCRGFNVKTSRFSTTGKTNEAYNAFPYFIIYGTRIIGIYSEGPAHGASERQIMVEGARSADAQTFSKVTFYENSTGEYNLSLLEGMIPVGGSIVLKVWTIKNIGGTLTVFLNSTVDVGGLTYALWGDVLTTGGNYYRTGYSSVAGNYNAAIFRSLNLGETWEFIANIVTGDEINGRLYSEAALMYIGSGVFKAIVRDDSVEEDYVGPKPNNLWIVSGSSFGVTWGAPVLLEGVSGRQPKLTLISGSGGKYALTVGKRTGTGGDSGIGNIDFGNRTGIQMFISTDNFVTYGAGTMIDTFYSTDGGQPWAICPIDNRILVPYYKRRAVNENPDTYTVSLDINGLEKQGVS